MVSLVCMDLIGVSDFILIRTFGFDNRLVLRHLFCSFSGVTRMLDDNYSGSSFVIFVTINTENNSVDKLGIVHMYSVWMYAL